MLTTHSMAEAETLSDRIGFMHMSRLRAVGTPHGSIKKHGKGRLVEVVLNDGAEEDGIIAKMSVGFSVAVVLVCCDCWQQLMMVTTSLLKRSWSEC